MADRDIEDALAALALPRAEALRADHPPSTDRLAIAVGCDAGEDTVCGPARRLARNLGVEPHCEVDLERSSVEADYERAERAYVEGDLHEAVDRLVALVVRTQAAPVSLALAICAARLGQYQEADTLARASLHEGPRNPRAICLIGICALLRGDKSEAQARLALAARLARGHEEYREDMRSAQKLLLIRHFA